MRRLSHVGLSQRYQGRNPRRNITGVRGQKRPEAKLLKTFQSLYLKLKAKPGICLFDLDLPGYGIPDLIWISWHSDLNSADATALSYEALRRRLAERRLSAFEIKVSDWRKALLQAQRYRYFADRSIVVVPTNVAQKAIKHIEAFKASRVGLWGIDDDANRIVKYYTPIGTSPLSAAAKKKLSVRILKGLKLRKLSKRPYTVLKVL
jgi:hypothetical protein